MFDGTFVSLQSVSEPVSEPASETTPETTPDRLLQSALEFAVSIAALGAKLRPPLPFPAGLKPFLKFHKLPATALAAVRAAVEGDDEYWRRLGIAVQPELVDEAGTVWLSRPAGWQQRLAELVAASADSPHDVPLDARREQKRREAAETAAARARVEVLELRDVLDREREAAAALRRDRDRVVSELEAARSRARELESGARRQAAGSGRDAARAEATELELAQLREQLAQASAARDAALAERVERASGIDVERMRQLLTEALALAGEQAPARRRRVARAPLAIPGGLYGRSEAAAEHLLRSSGVLVLVDGYNVAKLGWPDLSLEQQREACVDACERLATRWGIEVHVVFDGSSVVGGHTRRRRLVRVSFSPEGVSADDVLRAQVAALDPSRAVVVVTNDQAVVTDVRAAGANTVPSDTFLAIARR